MTLRPYGGQPNPGRGGEGRRLRWSESAIPRRATRRVRGVGVPPPPEPLCTNETWVLSSSTPTSATYVGSLSFVSCGIAVTYDCVATGAVNLWVEDVIVSGGATDATPTDPYEITGPDLGGFVTFYFDPPGAVGGSGTITGITLNWDVADAFSTLCATAINYE